MANGKWFLGAGAKRNAAEVVKLAAVCTIKNYIKANGFKA